jgi:23S rRNA (guanosine2251-2'-O)-methyltransferase
MSKDQYWVYGFHAVEAILKASPQQICTLLAQEERRDQRLQAVLALAANQGIKVQIVAKKKLDDMLPNSTHQGVMAAISSKETYGEKDIPDLLANLAASPCILILDGIQDPHNLGACLRSANAAGVNLVIAPKDHSVGLTAVVRKTASGAAELTPFIRVTNLVRTMQMLKERGIWLYGADSEAKNTIYSTDLKGAVAIALGAEGTGLRRLTQENCDALIKIPMYGNVPSLNVSVAAGICLFEVCRQKQQSYYK